MSDFFEDPFFDLLCEEVEDSSTLLAKIEAFEEKNGITGDGQGDQRELSLLPAPRQEHREMVPINSRSFLFASNDLVEPKEPSRWRFWQVKAWVKERDAIRARKAHWVRSLSRNDLMEMAKEVAFRDRNYLTVDAVAQFFAAVITYGPSLDDSVAIRVFRYLNQRHVDEYFGQENTNLIHVLNNYRSTPVYRPLGERNLVGELESGPMATGGGRLDLPPCLTSLTDAARARARGTQDLVAAHNLDLILTNHIPTMATAVRRAFGGGVETQLRSVLDSVERQCTMLMGYLDSIPLPETAGERAVSDMEHQEAFIAGKFGLPSPTSIALPGPIVAGEVVAPLDEVADTGPLG